VFDEHRNAVAGDAGHIIDDGNALADQPIKDAAFADVWATDNYDAWNRHQGSNSVALEKSHKRAVQTLSLMPVGHSGETLALHAACISPSDDA
jgi:hypothetical protein